MSPRPNEGSERDGGDRRAPVSGADELFMPVEIRGRARRDAPPKLTVGIILPATIFSREQLPAGIFISRSRRLQRHVETRKRLRDRRSRKAPIKGHRHSLQITAKFVMCILLGGGGGTLRCLLDRYMRLRLRTNRLFPVIPALRAFLPSYCRIRGRLRGCVIASRPPLKCKMRKGIHSITLF